MRTIKTMLLALLSTSILSIQAGFAQTNIYKAQLAPVTQSGYYNIELDNRFVGSAKKNFVNLRIFQQNQGRSVEVPYFIRPVKPSSKETKMIDYPILNRIEKDSINRFVVHNPEKRKITDFYVTINKADVAIMASVKGSNNQEDWFIVKQKQPIYTYVSSEQGEATLFVGVPEGHYQYYELELINNQATPLKLNKVSTVVDTQTYGQFSPTLLKYDANRTKQKEKTTVVSFVQQEMTFKLNKVSIKIEAPQDYYRKAILKDSITKVSVPLTLSSKTSNEFIVNDLVVQNPYLEIFNGNNTPLTIKAFNTYSLARFATAYLEAHVRYEVVVNNTLVETPEYDIQHFKNEIPLLLPIVKTLDFNLDIDNSDQIEKEDQTKKMNTVLWAVLAIVGLLVAYICYRTFKKLEH